MVIIRPAIVFFWREREREWRQILTRGIFGETLAIVAVIYPPYVARIPADFLLSVECCWNIADVNLSFMR